MMTDAATAARYASRVGETAGRLTFLGLAPDRGDGGRLLGRFKCVCGHIVIRPVGRTLNAKQRLSEHSVFRWVNGQFDPRRNTFTKPLEDCYVVARY